MIESIFKWIRKFFNKLVRSIAFVPLMLGLGFLLLGIFTIEMDRAGLGERLNNKFTWLALQDPETARTIVATVITGVISLTVFSFSMVMVVMNQAVSQMSNRMLNNFIGERVQKWVLGCFIGTLIYALFLIVNINKEGTEGHAPSLSVYILLLFTVFDIFLFAYFLHYITQSFRFEQLIQRIHNRTQISFDKICKTADSPEKEAATQEEDILALNSGYFQGFVLKRLLKLATHHDIVIRFLHPEGTYVLKGTPFIAISPKGKLNDEWLRKLHLDIDFFYGQDIDRNPYYGFQHLMEVGVKALSPGINDPGTAVLSLNAIADLLIDRMQRQVPHTYQDAKGIVRIITKEKSFAELFEASVLPIWDYGRKDRVVQNALLQLLNQLQFIDKEGKHKELLQSLKEEVLAERDK